ncbi:TrmB family transcriptional regulator [Castellaniella sp.]|uniref:TrmB family transcriptional regulator n=1 Tax=Castellaniella sp. TaxID=1955812 RepID=UPI00355DA8C1
MVNVDSILEQVGLSGSRARFYLAALAHGEATVAQVAKRAGVGRTNAYEILNALVRDGLLNQIEKSGKTYVVAENPNTLLGKAQNAVHGVESILPDLQALYSDSLTKPRIRYYSGVEGIVNVMNDSLTCRSRTLHGILSMAELLNVPGKDFMRDHIKRRIEAGIWLNVIRSESEEIELIWPSSAQELREVRMSRHGAPFTMTSYVYDDKVAYISSKKENFAMIVQSAEFAGLQKMLFETLWASCQA